VAIITKRKRVKREKKETNGKNMEASRKDILLREIMKFTN
jgi:hypothetical protein